MCTVGTIISNTICTEMCVETFSLEFLVKVSHTTINPHGIVAIGPALDYEAPHGREHLGQ